MKHKNEITLNTEILKRENQRIFTTLGDYTGLSQNKPYLENGQRKWNINRTQYFRTRTDNVLGKSKKTTAWNQFQSQLSNFCIMADSLGTFPLDTCQSLYSKRARVKILLCSSRKKSKDFTAYFVLTSLRSFQIAFPSLDRLLGYPK